MQDWINNIWQPAGESSDMWESIRFALVLDKKYEDFELTMIGHSKGGGEAIANAIATGRKAITFNPMHPNLVLYGLDASTYDDNKMTHYIVKEEILMNYLGIPYYGETILLEPWYETPLMLRSSFLFTYSGIRNHLMPTMIAALRDYFEKMQCPE